MVMDTIQIRMSHGLVEMMDSLVEKGIYANRSDVIRDSVRRFVWADQVGIIKLKGSGVNIIRKARRELSKQKIDLDEINNL
ncbi:MAG: ribbon-helix-helix domain-containing protein [Candidatus Nanoarchaeia archaeon]|jgi:metal-responsive CopG/Arc/MetJ family transcriptional regulator